jgi:hypothetical protein
MSDKAALTEKPSATTTAAGNDNLAAYADKRPQKDTKKDNNVPGLTTLDVEVGLGGGALLLGGGYVAYEGLHEVKSLNSGLNLQLSNLNSQIGTGLGTLQGDITGLEGQLPALKLGLTSGVTSLAGIQQELGTLNTNLTGLETTSLKGQGLTSLQTSAMTSSEHGRMFQAAIGNKSMQSIQAVHAFSPGAGHLTLIPHTDFRSALERGPAAIGTMSTFHGLGNFHLKEHMNGAVLHAKPGIANMHVEAIHIAAPVKAPMVRATHVKVK